MEIFKKKIRFITSPTIETKKRLIKIGIFDKENSCFKRSILSKQNFKFQKKNFKNRNKFLAIGRLTKQKNFSFLVDCFETILKINPKATLTIAGEGERERNNLSNLIYFKNLEKKIKLVGYKKDVQKLYKTHDCFILSSLWEDPGFVLVEAASKFIPIISSDCKSGPRKFLIMEKICLFIKRIIKKDFLKKYKEFLKIKNKDLRKSVLI